MPNCVIKGCKNRPNSNPKTENKNAPPAVTFHRFPVNKKELMEEWLNSIGFQNMKDQVKVIQTSSIICSDHFEKQYLKFVGKRTRLSPDAVPTIFKVASSAPAPKVGRWILDIKDMDNFETILMDKPNELPSLEDFQGEEVSPSIAATSCGEPSGTEIDCNMSNAGNLENIICTEGESDKKSFIVEETHDDDEESLSCFSPDALSKQLVALPKFMPNLQKLEAKFDDSKISVPFPTTVRKKLNIPSTCLKEEHVHGSQDDGQNLSTEKRILHEKVVILRAKSREILKKKRLKFPRKIPAQAIKNEKTKSIIVTQSEEKNKALARTKTEWIKPAEDLVCIADMGGMEKNDVVPTKVNELCRICTTKGDFMVAIFSKQGKEFRLAEKIHQLLPIQVTEEDKLPLLVCRSCCERLEASEQLVMCSQEADLKLRLMLDAEDMQFEVEEIHVPEPTASAVPEEPVTLPTPAPQAEKLVCTECKKVFREFSRYARHCYGVHKMKKCKNCYRFFDTKEQLIEHKIEDHGIPCDCCGAKFVNINAQLSHLRRVHPEYKSCTCEVCGKSFNSKYGLAVHYECHQEDRPFLCDTCGKSFKSKRKLKIHKCISNLNEALRADNVCPECGKVYTLRSSLKRHLMRHRGERRYQCEICSKSFFGSAYLKNHMVIHEKATLYECQMCCARYFHKRNMISHLKMKHSMPWNYKCPTCDQIFPSIDDVVMHRKIHDIENIALGIPQESDIPQGSCLDFQCKICGKNFENIYVLTYHFEEHVIRNQEDLNIKMSGADGCLFECAYCGETQTSIWTMKRHVKKAHHETPSAGLIEYECEYCAKRFTTKSQVRQHLLLHTGEKPFHCQYCNAGFRTQIALKVHIRTHTGETPYHCQRCPKRFRSAATLRSHQGTHDKPFACPHCGQRFPKKAAFKKHVVLHTGETSSQARRAAVEHKCKHCDYVSRSRSAIKKHEVVHTDPTYFNL